MFANVSVTADGFSEARSSASMSASAEVYTLGGLIKDVNTVIDAQALVNCLGNATFSGDAIINADGTITALGYLLGEEWSDSEVGTETWTTSSTGSEVWVEDTPESNTWLRQG
jgi:pectate lyase